MLGLPPETEHVYGKWAGRPATIKEDTSRCRYEVWPNERGGFPHQCCKKKGKGYKGWFCGIHARFFPADYIPKS